MTTAPRRLAAGLILLSLVVLHVAVTTVSAEIHRAKHSGKVVLYEHGTQRHLDLTEFDITDEEEESEGEIDPLGEEPWVWNRRKAWCCSICASFLIGLSGIFPLLVIPLEAGPSLKHGGKCANLWL